MVDHARLPASAAHVFVEDVSAPELSAEDDHHVNRVLRLRDGEFVTISDGAGQWRACRWRGRALEVDGPVERAPRPAPEITIAFAIVKGDRPEWAVQKLTELGADRIVPVVADRSVVRWDDARAARNVERLRAVARSAAMQSRRIWFPHIAALTSSAELGPGLAFAHPGGDAPSLVQPAVAVGPEGGWSDAELSRAATTVDLGPRTLRTETAAVAIGALLTGLRTGLVGGLEGKNT